MDIRDYLYRGQVVRTQSIVSNSTIVQRSSCWVTIKNGDHRYVTGESKVEVEQKIDRMLEIRRSDTRLSSDR